MIHEALPPAVVAEERFADAPAVVLFPEEEAVVRASVERRRREFAAGRACARAALARLGRPAGPLLPDERGAPLWPAGIVGSITHCAGYCCAAVASTDRVAALGIDAEPHEPLPPDVVAVVARPEERERLDALAAAEPTVRWDRLLFCCKEATYKAWYPATRRWLGFEDASITLEPRAGAFSVELLRAPLEVGGRRLTRLAGRWVVGRGLVVAAIAIERG